MRLPHSTASSSPPTSAHASSIKSPSSPAPVIRATHAPVLSGSGKSSRLLPINTHATGVVLSEGTLLPVAAALLAILAWSLAVGSSLGGVTSGRLLPIAALLTIATLLSIAARLPVGVLLRVTALIITSRLCRGIAGGRIGRRSRDRLHGVAPRHLGVAVVTLSVPQAGLVVAACAGLRLTALSRFVTVLWSRRCGGGRLLPVGWVSRLSAIRRLRCIGGLGGSDRGRGGIVSTSAIPLDRLTVGLGGSWRGITCGRLSVRSGIGCLPIGSSGLSLGVADISGLSVGSIALLPICLRGLCVSLSGLGGVSAVALLGCSLAVGAVIRGRHFLSF